MDALGGRCRVALTAVSEVAQPPKSEMSSSVTTALLNSLIEAVVLASCSWRSFGNGFRRPFGNFVLVSFSFLGGSETGQVLAERYLDGV
jgi:hypothetical protein